MDDQRTGEGGAANTPPFPRIDSRADPPADHEPAPPDPARRDERDDTAPAAADPPEAADRDDAARSWSAAEPDRRTENGTGFARGARDRIRRRASSGIDRGFERIADRLDEAAERLERVAADHLAGEGPRERAALAARSTADRLADVSGYLRDSDLDAIRADLERQVRDRPLRSVAIAVAAGWVLGRIMR